MDWFTLWSDEGMEAASAPDPGQSGQETAPQQTSQAPGHVTLPIEEWNQLQSKSQRWKQQLDGSERAFKRFRDRGLDPSNLDDDTLEFLSTLSNPEKNRLGINAKTLYQELFGQGGVQEEHQQQPVGGMTQAQIQQLIQAESQRLMEQRFSEYDQKSRAEREYESAKAQEEQLINRYAEQLGINLKSDDPADQWAAHALQGFLLQKRAQAGFYDEGPLANQLKRLSEDHLKDLPDWWNKASEASKARWQMGLAEKGKKAAPTAGASKMGTEPVEKEDKPKTSRELKAERESKLAEYFEQKSQAGQPSSRR